MVRSLERILKRSVRSVLRSVLGSQRITLPSDHDFSRILVVRQHNQLGDMLCVIPLLRALRAKYPSASIGLVASPVNAEMMLHLRYLDEVILYDKSRFLSAGLRGIANLINFIRMLRQRRFDVVLVPTTVSLSFTSDLIAYLSGARVRIGASSLDGVENPSAYFFNLPVALDWHADPHRHQTLRNVDMGFPLQGIRKVDLSLEISYVQDELDMRNYLMNKRKEDSTVVIVYHPGAGKKPNRWGGGKFAEVANRLAGEFGSSTVITAGPMDDEPVEEMLRSLQTSYTLLKGKPIREVAVVLSTCDLVVTNDTGIMHVAAATGVPVLSLFGPTDPQQWAPLGEQHRYIRGADEDVNAIQVSDVLENARAMLSRRSLNVTR